MDTKISIVFSFIAIAAAVLLFGGYGHGGYGGYGHGGNGNGGNGPSMAPCGGGPYSIVNGQIICTQVNG